MMAIDYTDELEAGWIIFPLHQIIRSSAGVSCGCSDPECPTIGKHPRASNWQHTQPYDADQLEYLEDFDDEFFGNQLIDNHGVVVASSGLLVVDVDGRNGGFDSASSLQHIRKQAKYIVRTGSGNGEHWYFTIPSDWIGKSLSGTLADYPGIDFKSTGFVVGAGCEHASGQRYEAIAGSPADVTEAPAELLALLDRPERTRFVMDGTTTDYSNEDLRGIVSAIPNTGRDYERWIRIGMGLHAATDASADGYDMWVAWSSQSDAHDERQMDMKWHSFGKSPNQVTLGTLIEWARENGWSAPVTFTDNTDWGELPEATDKSPEMDDRDDGYTYGGIVGAVYEWIDQQCLFPRKHISLAAALMAVSAAASLRYRAHDNYQVPLNLMIFCIADSGTGKEAVYQGLLNAMDTAGLSAGIYGEIKSEQELYRNAMRNQAAFYALDECGAMLGKIGSAKKKGGAAYLEGIPSAIMKIFTKTNGFLPLGGDVREDLRKDMERDLARLVKRQDDGKGDAQNERRIRDISEQIQQIGKGIKNPILSFFGITEPSSFDAAIASDQDLMVNGFLGRALMFREDEPLPLRRSNYNPVDMPIHIESRLSHLYLGGYAGEDDDKVRLQGPRETIPIDKDADDLLDEVYHYWRGQGQALAMDGQGIHSITTRVWEMVVKVAALLALPVSTTERAVIRMDHVKQAHAIVRRVTEYKIDHCKTVIGSDSTDKDERSQGMLAGVRSIIEGIPEGVGAGVIRNRMRSYKNPEGVNQCLDYLVERGEIEAVPYTDARNRKHVKYKKALQ